MATSSYIKPELHTKELYSTEPADFLLFTAASICSCSGATGSVVCMLSISCASILVNVSVCLASPTSASHFRTVSTCQPEGTLRAADAAFITVPPMCVATGADRGRTLRVGVCFSNHSFLEAGLRDSDCCSMHIMFWRSYIRYGVGNRSAGLGGYCGLAAFGFA